MFAMQIFALPRRRHKLHWTLHSLRIAELKLLGSEQTTKKKKSLTVGGW